MRGNLHDLIPSPREREKLSSIYDPGGLVQRLWHALSFSCSAYGQFNQPRSNYFLKKRFVHLLIRVTRGRELLGEIGTLVTPDTIWHPLLVAQKW
jgi:hypothetical protein